MSRSALFVVLFTVLLVSTGQGLVFPLFSAMLFDPHSTLVPSSTSEGTRGLLLGILLSSQPVAQMVVAPWIGRFSDRRGRRPAILCCLGVGILSALGSAMSIHVGCIIGLILFRSLMGVSFMSFALVNTCVVDASGETDRGRRLAWIHSAYGAGFALGPFLGGLLAGEVIFSTSSFVRPFIVSALIIFINIVCVLFWLPETRPKEEKEKEECPRSLFSVDKTVLLFLLSIFCFCFGWSMYIEFIPVWWIRRFGMSMSEVGGYSSCFGFWYVIFCSFFVGTMLKLFRPQLLFERASLMLALLFVPVFFITVSSLFLLLIPFQILCIAFLFPLSALIISEWAAPDDRGRLIGLQASAESFGLGLSPCLAGPLLGVHLLMPTAVAIICLSLASMLMRSVRKRGGRVEIQTVS